MAASSPLSLIIKPKHISPLHVPTLQFPSTQSSRRRSYYLNLPEAVGPKTTTKCWKISSTNGTSFLLLEASPVEISQETVSTTSEGGVSTVISALLLIAFIGLSILTIGVVYIAVTDFLQKREREKFEKEESSKKKKSGKKGKVRGRARAGPRGFGEKIEEDDDLDEAL